MAIRGSLVPLTLIGLVACSDLSFEPSRRPAQLQFVPDTVVIAEGETRTLEFEVLDGSGKPFSAVPEWSSTSWESLSPELVSVSAAGARGLRPGLGGVALSVAGLSGEIPVLINPSRLQLEVASVYLTQGTQRENRSVPLVAGRDALLRVFLRGGALNFFRPAVLATLYQSDGSKHHFRLERDLRGIPLGVERGDLPSSWNLTIPGSLLRVGTQLVIEADPDGLIPVAQGSVVRLPDRGRLDLDIVSVPDFNVRYVQVHLNAHGTTGSPEPADPMEFSETTYEQFPLAHIDASLREGVFQSDARLDTDLGWSQLILEIMLLRYIDRSDAYYYGLISRPGSSPWAGLGYIGFPVSIGFDNLPETAAHEFGHNFGLPHAPCGDPDRPDPDFPYPLGSIGTYGYSLGRGVLIDPTRTSDLMSYCRPRWISDYNYMKVLQFREMNDRRSTLGLRTLADQEVLVLWGGSNGDELYLEPAFRMRAPISLPEVPGPYRIEGYDELGGTLFSLSFSGNELDHQPGSRNFVFGVPLPGSSLDDLRRIRLVGPEGIAELRSPVSPTTSAGPLAGESALQESAARDPAAALIFDSATGRLLGVSRSGSLGAGAAAAGVELLLSDGVQTRSIRGR